MAKYYLDCEFLEGPQLKRIVGIKYGETKPTIDLISIGLVSEDGREYYAICNEFNVIEAWNRVQATTGVDEEPYYWIRENVLKPIYLELFELRGKYTREQALNCWEDLDNGVNLLYFKALLVQYGKSREQIAKEIKEFCNVAEKEYPEDCKDCGERDTCYTCQEIGKFNDELDDDVKFYGYYSAYDWVVFCQLFGIMMNIPSGFPYYCRDLKQLADDITSRTGIGTMFAKDANQHNALADARWNKAFHEFLISI